MKIKSFLPSKIMACIMCFMFYVAGVYLFVELKPEKYEALIYVCFLYGVICLGLTVVFYNLRRVYFYREKCVLHFGKLPNEIFLMLINAAATSMISDFYDMAFNKESNKTRMDVVLNVAISAAVTLVIPTTYFDAKSIKYKPKSGEKLFFDIW